MASEITITIKAQNQASPVVSEIKADFKGLAEEIGKAMDSANEKAESSGSKIGGALTKGLGVALNVVLAIPKAIAGAFGAVVDVAGSILNGLVAIVKGIVGAIVGAFEALPKLLGVVFNKITVVAAAAFGFVVKQLGDAAAESESFGLALDRLARKAGQNGAAIVAAIQKGAGATIPRLTAMRVANEALLANLGLTTGQFEQLAAVADVVSDTIGGDAATAFSTLIQALRAGNDRLLESIGINIEAETAYDNFARSVGKTATDLTELEKSQALVNAVLKETAGLVAESATSTDLLGDKFARLKVKLIDAFANVASTVGGALGIVADALDPIVTRVTDWVAANRELVAGEVGEFAERVAAGIGRVAEALPDIIDRIGSGLGQAFSFAQRAAELLWVGITNGVAGVQREIEIFRTAIVGVLDGKGFDVTGSALVAGFRVIKAQVKILALEAAAAFTESFGQAAADVANFARKISNDIITAKQLALGLKLVGQDFLEGVDTVAGFGAKGDDFGANATRRQIAELEAGKRLVAVTPDGLSKNLRASQSGAAAELDAALGGLAPILDDISSRGAEVREAAAGKVEGLKTALGGFFSADQQANERVLVATEDATAATQEALKANVALSEAVVAEQKKTRKTAEETKARVDELLRQMRQSASNLGVPLVTGVGG